MCGGGGGGGVGGGKWAFFPNDVPPVGVKKERVGEEVKDVVMEISNEKHIEERGDVEEKKEVKFDSLIKLFCKDLPDFKFMLSPTLVVPNSSST